MNDDRDIELSIVALENLSEIERPGTDSDGSHLDSYEVSARLSNEQNQQINQAQELLRMTLGSDEHSLDKEVEARLNFIHKE